MRREEFGEIGVGCTMETVMGVKEDFKLNAKVYREPV